MSTGHRRTDLEIAIKRAASTADDSTTVDWSQWMKLSPEEQRQLWSRYRMVLSDESARAKANNYRRMNEALYGPPK